jgi:uncharacterized protein
MSENQQNPIPAENNFVGTLVGESTSQEFRISVRRESIREQDIIAVNALLRSAENADIVEDIRIWAKVQKIERINPLFPIEAGHELAETSTNPFDTVLSMSREMVTAVCQVLGAENKNDNKGGKLDQLRYPPQPASSSYKPSSIELQKVILGELQTKKARALDLAFLANRPSVDVLIDGHAIVTRHLAILAMTGAGKSWTARRIVEQLAKKNYPMVIFDPHGDYTGLADVPSLSNKVHRYFAQFPIFDEDSDTVEQIVSSLGYPLSDTMRLRFGDVFEAAKKFLSENDDAEMLERKKWLTDVLKKTAIKQFGISRNLWLVSYLAEAAELLLREKDSKEKELTTLADWCWEGLRNYSKADAKTLEGIKKRTAQAAAALRTMERTNERVASNAIPLPKNRKELVAYGKISVVSLAGYTSDFQATLYSIISREIFEARVENDLKLPVLLVLEEAHNFVPANANTAAEQKSISVTKQLAQEGRKFGVGLVLISQRPSRLDETTLAMCNSFIIMRMVNPADQNFVRKVIESLGEDDARMLPDLDKGEAILSGQLISFPVLVKIKEPESKGEREEEDAFEALEKAKNSLNKK